MKKLLFLLFVSVLFVGCQKYEEESNPQLNVNGSWRISSITPTFSPALDNIEIVNNDYFAQSSYIVINPSQGDMMKLRSDTLNINPCFFYKMGYVWEFQYNGLTLKSNTGKILREYRISFGDSFYNPNDFTLEDKITGGQIAGNWHMSCNGNGAMPGNDLIITVPTIYFNIEGSGRSYDRFISQGIILTFTR